MSMALCVCVSPGGVCVSRAGGVCVSPWQGVSVCVSLQGGVCVSSYVHGSVCVCVSRAGCVWPCPWLCVPVAGPAPRPRLTPGCVYTRTEGTRSTLPPAPGGRGAAARGASGLEPAGGGRGRRAGRGLPGFAPQPPKLSRNSAAEAPRSSRRVPSGARAGKEQRGPRAGSGLPWADATSPRGSTWPGWEPAPGGMEGLSPALSVD
ncbi:unnamed protein product [Lepidochelys kempii]